MPSLSSSDRPTVLWRRQAGLAERQPLLVDVVLRHENGRPAVLQLVRDVVGRQLLGDRPGVGADRLVNSGAYVGLPESNMKTMPTTTHAEHGGDGDGLLPGGEPGGEPAGALLDPGELGGGNQGHLRTHVHDVGERGDGPCP